MQLLIGTNNAGKVTEIRECLATLPVELLTPDDLETSIGPPEETGSTYAENAVQKAKHYFDCTGIATLADDSGIEVDALADELGVRTRRWGAGPAASDEEWISYFLERMEKEENRKARFICQLAYVDAEGNLHRFQGICDGTITSKLEDAYLSGLPISACFRPNGYNLVYSAMSIEQKNSTSHRGKALQKFREHIARSFAH
ncbi:non-canonical purine NTP pyrophosphatase [Candidatus Peregrinibacteria bacterium CG10_big_fil_rev_8_21_14_0_10_49_10]|nr:MAG: non-canonical purine NTP pyrophosphatase [Candidatus Peregrinibacteria bacterium CG10_big_fil_rev_8_21_14_0_10_49_10]